VGFELGGSVFEVRVESLGSEVWILSLSLGVLGFGFWV